MATNYLGDDGIYSPPPSGAGITNINLSAGTTSNNLSAFTMSNSGGFDATWGYGMRPDLLVRNQEYQQFAIANYKEAAQDTHATLINRK